ncbi:myo-inosose-2 dehydratase [Paenibacillus selenitireducens]|uniref:Myo-inosose-2 dehydratase n=1 Tax=Paenibacillus selenitireducens TaxID=1324314 RepID=A0A1T2X694_9BACL|nr:myo-inosose-2 dehydratase [Paenibacillus selenitireducens]OPA75206.1 myo-inosose-2 dehydratase [Paenibacillus selenitireducens]
MPKDTPSIKLGISPINWVNEDVLELGDHYTFQDLMKDFTLLGFNGTENCRKFPQDASILRSTLAANGLQLTSQWKGVVFSDPAMRESELDSYRQHVEFLKFMGSRHVVTCELGGSIIGDPRRSKGVQDVIPLTDVEWGYLVDGLHQAGEICRQHDMKLVYHYHIGTVVERLEEIERLMESTNPELVHLLLDTGHAYYGGADPLALYQQFASRVAYIHLKDVREDVLHEVKRAETPFQQAVIQGVFTVPGDGCIDFRPLFQSFFAHHYDGWMILEAEQDPNKANPYEYAFQSKQYIESILRDINN